MNDEKFNPKEKERREESSIVRLSRRDKDLLCHVAVAGGLTSEQIRRLVFSTPGLAHEPQRRDVAKQSSAVVCRRRLKRLCGKDGGPPYLRRVSFRNAEGRVVAAYTLTPSGSSIAHQALRRPTPAGPSETSAQSISRAAALNEVYVALAEAAAKVRRAPSQVPFKWIARDATGLPWRECNRETGVFEERRLVPDGTLELAGERTRFFLERDGGGGRDEHAVASALVKLRRYSAFVMEGGERTFYAQKYPDGWKAELVFLFHFRERASDLSRAIEAWREKNRDVRLAARSFCIDGAVTHFASRLGLPRAIESGVPLDAADVRLICRWVPEVLTTYKAVRHYLRANPVVRAQGCPYPEYAPEFERMMAFAERLRSELQAIGGRGRWSSNVS